MAKESSGGLSTLVTFGQLCGSEGGRTTEEAAQGGSPSGMFAATTAGLPDEVTIHEPPM